MDSNTKKSRRRSLRNLRRSSCMQVAPLSSPSNYGTLWVEADEETKAACEALSSKKAQGLILRDLNQSSIETQETFNIGEGKSGECDGEPLKSIVIPTDVQGSKIIGLDQASGDAYRIYCLDDQLENIPPTTDGQMTSNIIVNVDDSVTEHGSHFEFRFCEESLIPPSDENIVGLHPSKATVSHSLKWLDKSCVSPHLDVTKSLEGSNLMMEEPSPTASQNESLNKGFVSWQPLDSSLVFSPHIVNSRLQASPFADALPHISQYNPQQFSPPIVQSTEVVHKQNNCPLSSENDVAISSKVGCNASAAGGEPLSICLAGNTKEYSVDSSEQRVGDFLNLNSYCLEQNAESPCESLVDNIKGNFNTTESQKPNHLHLPEVSDLTHSPENGVDMSVIRNRTASIIQQLSARLKALQASQEPPADSCRDTIEPSKDRNTNCYIESSLSSHVDNVRISQVPCESAHQLSDTDVAPSQMQSQAKSISIENSTVAIGNGSSPFIIYEPTNSQGGEPGICHRQNRSLDALMLSGVDKPSSKSKKKKVQVRKRLSLQKNTYKEELQTETEKLNSKSDGSFDSSTQITKKIMDTANVSTSIERNSCDSSTKEDGVNNDLGLEYSQHSSRLTISEDKEPHHPVPASNDSALKETKIEQYKHAFLNDVKISPLKYKNGNLDKMISDFVSLCIYEDSRMDGGPKGESEKKKRQRRSSNLYTAGLMIQEVENDTDHESQVVDNHQNIQEGLEIATEKLTLSTSNINNIRHESLVEEENHSSTLVMDSNSDHIQATDDVQVTDDGLNLVNISSLDPVQDSGMPSGSCDDTAYSDFRPVVIQEAGARRSLRMRPGRKSWDLYQSTLTEESAIKKRGGGSKKKLNDERKQDNPHCNISLEESKCADLDSGEGSFVVDTMLENLYRNKNYKAPKARTWETIKEHPSTLQSSFTRTKLKRYLTFDAGVTNAKLKARHRKALFVLNGKSKGPFLTDDEFQYKMLDIQLLLDTSLDSQG